MLHDAGILTICSLVETSEGGSMPKKKLLKLRQFYYGERTIGYGRQYAAHGAGEHVDLLAEIWQDREVRPGMYAVSHDNIQYRIDQVQHKENDEGLRVTWLSLRRSEDFYDIAEDA